MNGIQKIQEVQAKIEAVKQEIAALQNQQMRLNLIHQVQRHDIVRHTPSWVVNGRNKLEVNPGTS